ncbi:iron transporter [Halopelagius longus]|uniref:Fe2+ transport protein n=1 Tax=Halopelagius longus TaxID=1236180 RepID=A0A1H1DNB6_9EURY|nr:iron transporter [Halopelagius longus]RDI71400.1 Tat pathway signal protein [Halopelagius longus]SDQ77917.1 Fe2+ transport protein [Halopelagius longus]
MQRRRVLGAFGAAASGSLAGCLGGAASLFETTNNEEPPLVENRPDAVYVPTHREGMNMVGTTDAGDLKVGLFYSYPHRFWTVDNEGGEYVVKQTPIEDDDSVHLMATPWDPETGTVVPNTGMSLEITRDGSLVSEEVIYPMLSQRMGFHYGANFPLDGDGTYEVRVSVGGIDAARFGALAGEFEDGAAGTVEFEFSTRDLNDIPYKLLEDKQGQRGALRPMEMEMEMVPTGDAPDSLPGTSLGRGTSGDAAFVGSVVEADRFGEDPYLVVSARTPHNALTIPGMALSAEADGGETYSGRLTPGLDPELGFHYGASAAGLSGDADATVSVDVPPQVARHEGYETAFLDTGTFELQ